MKKHSYIEFDKKANRIISLTFFILIILFGIYFRNSNTMYKTNFLELKKFKECDLSFEKGYKGYVKFEDEYFYIEVPLCQIKFVVNDNLKKPFLRISYNNFKQKNTIAVLNNDYSLLNIFGGTLKTYTIYGSEMYISKNLPLLASN